MAEETQKQPEAHEKMYVDLSGRGGLAPRWYGDEGDTAAQHPEYRYLGIADQRTPSTGQSTAAEFAAGVYNSSRRYGYLCPPNNSFTAVTNNTGTAFGREIRAAVFDPVSKTAFYAENQNSTAATGCTLWQNTAITGTTWTTNANFTWPISTIDHFTDVEMYQINGVPYVFASYGTDSSTGDILVMLPGGGATGHTKNWLTAVASGGAALQAFDHWLCVSDYYMYVGEANLIHRIDGTSTTGGANGTFLSSVLVAPPNTIFTDGVNWNGNLWLASTETYPSFQSVSSVFPNTTETYVSGRCGVFVWDENITAIGNIQFINMAGVQIIQKLFVSPSGKMRALVVSAQRNVQIREYNGSTWDMVCESSIASTPRYRRSVRPASNGVYWTGKDGKIYFYGFITAGEAEALYILGDSCDGGTVFSSSTNLFMGATLFADDNGSATSARTAFLISGRDTSGGGTTKHMYWYPNKTGTTPGTGNVFTLVKYFPQLVKINYMRVYHHQGTASSPTQLQATMDIYFNGSASSTFNVRITQADVARGFQYIPVNQGAKGSLFGVQVKITWGAQGVNISDDTDFMPRLLEIDYTPLDKLK